ARLSGVEARHRRRLPRRSLGLARMDAARWPGRRPDGDHGAPPHRRRAAHAKPRGRGADQPRVRRQPARDRVDRHQHGRLRGVAIVEGRAFTEGDRLDSPRVAVVNETLAHREWPGQSAVGKVFHTRGGEGPAFQIVGVSADHKVLTLSEPPTPFLQIARAQRPSAYSAIVARTRGDAGALLRDMRRELLAIEPNVVFVENQTMEAEVDATLLPLRASAWLV